MTSLPLPRPGRAAAEEYVARHFAHLVCDEVRGSQSFTGGQAAADAALAAFDVTGYASRRNEVLPASRRGASRLSPYIRHGLLSLPEVLGSRRRRAPSRRRQVPRRAALAGVRPALVRAPRDPRLGATSVINSRARTKPAALHPTTDGPGGCRVSTLRVGELERDGWLVNQTRMWLAGHWTVREGLRWTDGEDHFFRHLLDGSRAANRLGWQWVTGAGSSKPYGSAAARSSDVRPASARRVRFVSIARSRTGRPIPRSNRPTGSTCSDTIRHRW